VFYPSHLCYFISSLTLLSLFHSAPASDFIRPASHFVFIGLTAFAIYHVHSYWLSSNKSSMCVILFTFDVLSFVTETVSILCSHCNLSKTIYLALINTFITAIFVKDSISLCIFCCFRTNCLLKTILRSKRDSVFSECYFRLLATDIYAGSVLFYLYYEWIVSLSRRCPLVYEY
jgi:hypothetical protein